MERISEATGRNHGTALARASADVRLALMLGALAAGMVGMSFAAVPLYRIFCQVTGYAGTTKRAETVPTGPAGRIMAIRFDANTAEGLAWRFEPQQRVVDVPIGVETLAFYRATNTSDHPITGTATFNVAPAIAGQHFNKIACFCFTEQVLQPGESVDMPVSFFVAPELLDDPDARDIQEITLSYTFYPVETEEGAAGAGDPPAPAAGG
ncbi:MAG: cytochrome c oxidase assembly protein [Rhizobiales bacterium]|nr:cytochrome c oxidase assembly protein [Hyphomicrobiales bacterium]